MMSSHIKAIAAMRFGQATNRKVGIKEYTVDMESSNLYGIIYLAEKILLAHNNNPYKSVEEILGDLQLEIVDAHNKLQIRWPKNTVRINVEHVMKQYNFTK